MIGTAEQYSMNKQNEYGMCRGTGRRTHTENRYPMTAMFRKYPDALRLNELADMLGVSTKLASRLVRDGTIPSVKIGREYRIAKSNAVKYLLGKQKECVVSVNLNPKEWTLQQVCGMLSDGNDNNKGGRTI